MALDWIKVLRHTLSSVRVVSSVWPNSKDDPKSGLRYLERRGPLRSSSALVSLFFVHPSRQCWRILILIFFASLSSLAGVAAPYFQKKFLEELPLGGSQFPLESIAFSTLASLVFLLAAAGTRIWGGVLAGKIQKKLSKALYLKSLNLATSHEASLSVGGNVSLFASDVPAVSMLLEDTVPSLVLSLIPIFLAPFALSLIHSIPLMLPLLVCTSCVAVVCVMAFFQSQTFTKAKELQEDRLAIVNEWIQNKRVIRLTGWEGIYQARIQKSREKETNNRILQVTLGSTMNSIMQATPFLVNAVGAAALMGLSEVSFSMGDIVSLFWIFGVYLIRPMRMFPWVVVTALDGWSSAKKLSEFLDLPDQQKSQFPSSPLLPPEFHAKGVAARKGDTHLALKLDHFKLNHPQSIESSAMLNIPLLLGKGPGLWGLAGPVASGKTLLLKSLIQETWTYQGRVSWYESNWEPSAASESLGNSLPFAIGYLPQEPFLMNATLRQNLELAYHTTLPDEQLWEALELAQLSDDVSHWKQGLDTPIGERGVNVSGGQKQRIALARAILEKKNVYLLDNALSALDEVTLSAITQKVLKGTWAQKWVVCATHQPSLLQNTERIWFVQKGQLEAIGPWNTLISNNESFRKYLNQSAIP